MHLWMLLTTLRVYVRAESDREMGNMNMRMNKTKTIWYPWDRTFQNMLQNIFTQNSPANSGQSSDLNSGQEANRSTKTGS